MYADPQRRMRNKYLLDRIIQIVREEMSFSSGGGAFYRGSGQTDSGSPTAGYDPIIDFDGRKKRYKSLSSFYQNSLKRIKKDVQHRKSGKTRGS